VGNLIWNLLEIYCSLQQWKNFANRSRIDKVIAMYRVAPFFLTHTVVTAGTDVNDNLYVLHCNQGPSPRAMRRWITTMQTLRQNHSHISPSFAPFQTVFNFFSAVERLWHLSPSIPHKSTNFEAVPGSSNIGRTQIDRYVVDIDRRDKWTIAVNDALSKERRRTWETQPRTADSDTADKSLSQTA